MLTFCVGISSSNAADVLQVDVLYFGPPMGFTKAQRLKGLKKQLANLGYEAVAAGQTSPESDGSIDQGDTTVPDSGRGAKTLVRFQAQDEGW